MMRWAIVQDSSITNVIVWDGQTPYSPLGDAELFALANLPEGTGIGWTRDGTGEWQPPVQSESLILMSP